MATLFTSGRFQAQDATGILAGAKLYTYAAGTLTPLATYTDQGGSTPNANPVVCDSNGQASVWLGSSTYRFRLYRADGVTLVYDTDNVATLGASTGDSLIGHIDSGANAVATTVQAKLRAIVSRSEFSSDGDFAAAKGSRPNIDGSNNFDANVKPTGENAASTLASLIRPASSQGRSPIRYRTTTTIRANIPPTLTMAGFRFAGSYSKVRAPVIASGSAAAGSLVIDFASTKAFETSMQVHNWYGLFAVATNGDASASYRVVPFLRVKSVAGSVITLQYAGEGASAHSLTNATYTFTTNGLQNADCLVITETMDTQPNAFSGRVTSITANTTTTVTLNAIGNIAAYDWILPAPKFDQYVYLGSFYSDAGPDVRNISDSGVMVKAKMVTTSDPAWVATGSIASATKISFGGYIPPLATAVYVKSTETVSTASTGDDALNIHSDSAGHEIVSHYLVKEGGGGSKTDVADDLSLPFSFGQYVYVLTGGSLAGSRSGCSIDIKGWIEP